MYASSMVFEKDNPNLWKIVVKYQSVKQRDGFGYLGGVFSKYDTTVNTILNSKYDTLL